MEVILEYRGNVVRFSPFGNQTGSSIEDRLEFIDRNFVVSESTLLQ